MLAELFTEFASKYLNLTSQSFQRNDDTDILCYDIRDALTKLAAISESNIVYGSVGNGGWVEVPWLAILDKDITTSTMRGYYVVFLYSADMSKLYLTLGIGWEQYQDAYGIKVGRIRLENTVHQLQRILRSPLNDFQFTGIDLKAVTTRGKGYKSGTICYKEYDIKNLPNDEVIINDVRNLMGVYRELKGLVGSDIFNLLLQVDEESDNTITLDEVKPEFLTDFRLQPYIHKESIKVHNNIHHVDFDEIHRKNANVGRKGEDLVLQNERDFLIQSGRKDLADKVEMISATDISAGYDILSFNKDGEEKLIEVKTTVLPRRKEFSFNISKNELDVAEKSNNYFIYLVFDVHGINPKIVAIKNPFKLGMLSIEPIHFIVKGNSE